MFSLIKISTTRLLLFIAALAVFSVLAVNLDHHDTDTAKVSATATPGIVRLTEKQRKYVVVAPVANHQFVVQRDAVGYVDFNQDKAVQVFSPWAGRISHVSVKAGDQVQKGQLLFVVDSPDLVQAESTLITTAAVLKNATSTRERLQNLTGTQAVAQKDFQQAVSDLQSAEANYRAARESVRIFGRSDGEIDRLVATRQTDPALRITSPIAGVVTARNAADGLLTQPGNAPAPIIVSDMSTLWLVANVAESDVQSIRTGQVMRAELPAIPGREFEGHITSIGSSVDPVTHTLPVHADIVDKDQMLRPQMLANFHIETGKPQESIAVQEDGLVREGDGTTVAFVTRDGIAFSRRPVQIGVRKNGLVQILSGLNNGEMVAAEGALLLSNSLALQAR